MSNRNHRINFTSKLSNAVSDSHPRNIVIAIILLTALFAFEMFNFDTTRYALNSLLGDVTFLNVGWATILAIAFCAIDFAGLARLFTPEQGSEEPKEVWYLTGAWLLGATMNAMMTWWAVSLTLLNHDLGNEVLSREQLLQIVPIFVAALVWLTRILFIGSLTVAGEHLFDFHGQQTQSRPTTQKQSSRVRPAPKASSRNNSRTRSNRPAAASFSGGPREELTYVDEPELVARPQAQQAQPVRSQTPQPVRQQTSTSSTPARPSRVQRRPPVAGVRPGMPVGMQAKDNGSFDTRKKMN